MVFSTFPCMVNFPALMGAVDNVSAVRPLYFTRNTFPYCAPSTVPLMVYWVVGVQATHDRAIAAKGNKNFFIVFVLLDLIDFTFHEPAFFESDVQTDFSIFFLDQTVLFGSPYAQIESHS